MSTPYLIVGNAEAAIAYYQNVFGAELKVRLLMPDGKTAHAELHLPLDQKIMLGDEFPEMGFKSPLSLGGSPVSLYLRVADVDQVFAAGLAAGGQSQQEPTDQFDGDRRGSLIDPFGHSWLIASKMEDLSFDEMTRRFAALMNP
ncbi:PhnB protein [Paucibacter oligotrophus]|uniref:PhnB protein n=1 Tax=Roseateles oligotrophus TaxID=1769250 RepID=A0A840LGB5_9BURK|nr:VOC family protein [Roseateles oligotrophus]MBB4845663.1 PhnB protein [Roseateles oligotrophus]